MGFLYLSLFGKWFLIKYIFILFTNFHFSRQEPRSTFISVSISKTFSLLKNKYFIGDIFCDNQSHNGMFSVRLVVASRPREQELCTVGASTWNAIIKDSALAPLLCFCITNFSNNHFHSYTL